MAKKQKQPTKTCADCVHENACRIWTDGRCISYASASQCPNHETVKESSAYLCGVLDERKRRQTNADKIRAMSDEELAEWLTEFANEAFAAGAIRFGGALMTEHDRLTWLQQPCEGGE